MRPLRERVHRGVETSGRNGSDGIVVRSSILPPSLETNRSDSSSQSTERSLWVLSIMYRRLYTGVLGEYYRRFNICHHRTTSESEELGEHETGAPTTYGCIP